MDITKVSHKFNKECKVIKHKSYLNNLITRVLLCTLLFLCTLISLKLYPDTKDILNKYIYNNNFDFVSIKNLYNNFLGNMIPSKISNGEEVVGNFDNITNYEYDSYLDGVKIKLSKDSPISVLCGGIVVYIGDKENYGNVVIIQGNDGIDYTYGNISVTDVSLYDYIENKKIIGTSLDNYIYLTLEKDGEYVNYNDYF